jgi:CobQ-like glutamine amidotransferase family enzyme
MLKAILKIFGNGGSNYGIKYLSSISDLLNVYGDVGNILILKHRAEARILKVNIYLTFH